MPNPYHPDRPEFRIWERAATLHVAPEVCNEDLRTLIEEAFMPEFERRWEEKVQDVKDEASAEFDDLERNGAFMILEEEYGIMLDPDRDRTYKR